mmetsp:Transcript_2335/g.2821  ORF Transcript_2335/g.2821 Transcript_2335/m.2821 type:complete len:241 (-) Transcript_2335:85-807(-)
MWKIIIRFFIPLSLFLLLPPKVLSFTHLDNISVNKRAARRHDTRLFGKKGVKKPKLIVFDLDGCIWSPEMYELAWDGSRHSPFEPWNNDGTKMKSQLNSIVCLIGDVPGLLDDFVVLSSKEGSKWSETRLAISSRTDVPAWAYELLGKMTLPKSGKTLKEVILGPWEIAKDSKVTHFRRLAKKTGVALEDMVFFDNERGNCIQVAKLGVTVAYTPNGVKRTNWQQAIDNFPTINGKVIGV